MFDERYSEDELASWDELEALEADSLPDEEYDPAGEWSEGELPWQHRPSPRCSMDDDDPWTGF